MKTLILTGAVIASVSGFHAQAVAQGAPIYRYCLQESGGRDGNSMTWCRFDTLAQCAASRNGSADFCYPNPAYPQPRR
ncbi:MAG: DUF3551 domain-containing protein [Xanthobacteraceae bacterium]